MNILSNKKIEPDWKPLLQFTPVFNLTTGKRIVPHLHFPTIQSQSCDVKVEFLPYIWGCPKILTEV